MRILTSRKMFPSARLIRDDLEKLFGNKIWLTDQPKPGISLRWGSTLEVGYEIPLNDLHIINLSSNKLKWSAALQAAEIYTPIYKTEAPTEADYPILVRTTLQGFGGAGIHVCETSAEYARFAGHYWTKFIKIFSEFRVHVLGTSAVKLFRKVREENLPEVAFPIRNLHRGYSFKRSILEQKPKLISVVNNVLTAIGATESTMMALDVGWTDNGWLVLEGNSAPAMANPNTRSLYVDHIVRVLRS